ncbi:MAG TPA: photosystem II biogenesis protein Psp29 [Cyanothece sp. UBA12306]|nr:photosystem II biogenesis protein Psp29 [Cyanothece sp. UBA12306]
MDKVRTVSDTKRDFYTYHNRPINSIYRRFIEEILVEMHLLCVNTDFRYDPIYALGVVTSYERFIQGYRPEEDQKSIFSAICQAVGLNADQCRQDAQTLLEKVKDLSMSDLMTKINSAGAGGSEEGILLSTLQAIAQNPQFKYSRLFAIGLYTMLMEIDVDLVKNQEKRNQTLSQLCKPLNLSEEKLQKDLDLYRSNLDKMEQLLAVIEDTLEAERKKREKAKQDLKIESEDSPTN